MCVCVCVCVGSDEKDDECSVVVCVCIISRAPCALGCLHILLILLFLYCVLRAHARCNSLVNTLLFYITLI